MRGKPCARSMSRAKHAHIGRQLAGMDDTLLDIINDVEVTYGVASVGAERANRARRVLMALRFCLDGNLEREHGCFNGINDVYFPRDLPEDLRG